jgi:hypothetical protein
MIFPINHQINRPSGAFDFMREIRSIPEAPPRDKAKLLVRGSPDPPTEALIFRRCHLME